MNIYQQGFKEDILTTIFKLTGRTWLKITGVYSIQAIISRILLLIVISTVVIGELDYTEFAASMNDPQVMLEFYQEFFDTIKGSPAVLTSILVLGLIFCFIVSWSTNIKLLFTDSEIRKGQIPYNELFRKSFSTDVFRIFGAFVLLYLIIAGLFVLVGAVAEISGFLSFVFILGIFVFMFRFILVIPAMIIGKLSIKEAFLWSMNNITWLRGGKILGIGFLAFLILVVVFFIIGIISAAFAFIPVIGPIILLAVNILSLGVLNALTVSTTMGLYFRYSDEIEDDRDIDLDDMLISK